MPNTKEGGQTLRKTMIKKYGSEEAYKAFMRSIASQGGKVGTTGGFYVNRELAREAGQKGGRISRRKPRTVQVEQPKPRKWFNFTKHA